MAKNKKLPGSHWYNAMDRLYAKKYEPIIREDLSQYPELIELLGPYREHFIGWAGLSRVHHEGNIREEVKEFLELPWMKIILLYPVKNVIDQKGIKLLKNF